jgi:transposase InsO family protein
LAAKIGDLGISLSFSGPRVSNDNAYVKSWFRTMKYHQSYPVRRFRDLLSVRAWVDGFVDWYNTEHRHSSIKNVTPNQRHYGEADAICKSGSRPRSRRVRNVHAVGLGHLAIGLSRRSSG